jgi:hypothetical protein
MDRAGGNNGLGWAPVIVGLLGAGIGLIPDWSCRMIHESSHAGLKSVADDSGYEPPQGNVLPLRRLPQMLQEVIGQRDPNLRLCAHADARSATSVAVSAMSLIHSLSLQRPNLPEGSVREPCTSVRFDQVEIDLREAQPAGESDLPVVGVPGFPGLILRPAASAGVHDRHSLSMTGEAGVRALVRASRFPVYETIALPLRVVTGFWRMRRRNLHEILPTARVGSTSAPCRQQRSVGAASEAPQPAAENLGLPGFPRRTSDFTFTFPQADDSDPPESDP